MKNEKFHRNSICSEVQRTRESAQLEIINYFDSSRTEQNSFHLVYLRQLAAFNGSIYSLHFSHNIRWTSDFFVLKNESTFRGVITVAALICIHYTKII